MEIRQHLETAAKHIGEALAQIPIPPPPPPDVPEPEDLWTALAHQILTHPHIPDRLRAAVLAQSLAESGRAESKLATEHLNFWGMKWRTEMAAVCTYVEYEAHDGRDLYCKFADLEQAVRGYWRFLQREPYQGHLDRVLNPQAWIQFIGPIWCPPGYKEKYLEEHEGRDYDDEVVRLMEEVAIPKLVSLGWTPPRPGNDETGAMKAWIPYAEDWRPRHKQRGKYRKGYPEGAVIHWGAGSSMASIMQTGNDDGWTFLGIDRKGVVWQSHPLTHYGYHSGTPHHFTCVGIELDAMGTLTLKNGKWTSWFGGTCPAEETRTIHARNGHQFAGTYHVFTRAQEEALVELLMWLKGQAPEIFDFDKVIGHDEACIEDGHPGRKVDPGAALSMTMPAFRQYLKDEWERRQNDN